MTAIKLLPGRTIKLHNRRVTVYPTDIGDYVIYTKRLLLPNEELGKLGDSEEVIGGKILLTVMRYSQEAIESIIAIYIQLQKEKVLEERK